MLVVLLRDSLDPGMSAVVLVNLLNLTGILQYGVATRYQYQPLYKF